VRRDHPVRGRLRQHLGGMADRLGESVAVETATFSAGSFCRCRQSCAWRIPKCRGNWRFATHRIESRCCGTLPRRRAARHLVLDAGERLTKTELARVIRTIVKGKDWTQRWTADVPGIAPADVSDLMRGKLARFSEERLEPFLSALSIPGRPCRFQNIERHDHVPPRQVTTDHAGRTHRQGACRRNPA